jgi:toxin ParE1/3/4
MKLRDARLRTSQILPTMFATMISLAALRLRAAIVESLQSLTLFSVCQAAPTVRKLVTREYVFLIYYTVDEVADEIVVLNVKHPSRKREHTDL